MLSEVRPVPVLCSINSHAVYRPLSGVYPCTLHHSGMPRIGLRSTSVNIMDTETFKLFLSEAIGDSAIAVQLQAAIAPVLKSLQESI